MPPFSNTCYWLELSSSLIELQLSTIKRVSSVRVCRTPNTVMENLLPTAYVFKGYKEIGPGASAGSCSAPYWALNMGGATQKTKWDAELLGNHETRSINKYNYLASVNTGGF